MLNIETGSRVINSSTKSMTQANTCVPPEIGKHGSKARTPIVMAKTTWLVQETQSVALVVDIDIKSSRSTQTIAHCSNNPNSQFWARGAAGAADGGENLRDATSADRPKNPLPLDLQSVAGNRVVIPFSRAKLSPPFCTLCGRISKWRRDGPADTTSYAPR